MPDNTTFVLHIDFSILRLLEDNSAVNTSIASCYRLLTIEKKAYEEAIDEIEKDLNVLKEKYISKYRFNPHD